MSSVAAFVVPQATVAKPEASELHTKLPFYDIFSMNSLSTDLFRVLHGFTMTQGHKGHTKWNESLKATASEERNMIQYVLRSYVLIRDHLEKWIYALLLCIQ